MLTRISSPQQFQNFSMLPYTHPSHLLDSSCNFINDEFPAYPNYFPLNPENFNNDDPFENLVPVLKPVLPDQESGTKKTKAKKSRTDRHSKIRTAQGLRDRRMRLSLDVAHKFFGLQDLLGFDKASSTVDWLITQSRSAIEKHLINLAKSSDNYTQDASISAYSSKKKKFMKEKEVAVVPSPSTRVSFPHLLARNSRAEARARARERTKQKKKKMVADHVDVCEVGQLESIQDIYDTIDKDLDSSLLNQRTDYEYLSMEMAGELSQQKFSYYSINNNEESLNFFHEQLTGNFSGKFVDQQPSPLAEVQFRSCTACNMNPII